MENLDNYKRVHFVGVGGISVSALAKWCLKLNKEVTGSDRVFSHTLTELSELGAKVYVGENPTVAAKADLVVYSSAVSMDNSELVAAVNAGREIMCRHKLLGLLEKEFDKVVAVSGTHGKTTTTALLALMLKNAGKGFTAHIGGEALDTGGNLYFGGKDILVTEACEYRKSFLSLHPDFLVILNIESDHPDCYRDISEIYDGFAEFVENVRNKGFIIINDTVEYDKLHISTNAHILRFGEKVGDYMRAINIVERNGVCEYDITLKGEYYASVKSALYGRHNIGNCLAAASAANLMGCDKESVVSAIENFKGVKRRFEQVGEINGAKIILDYAHHPTELKAVIKTAKEMSDTVRVYFQPHTYTRTDKYFKEFAFALMEADEVNFLATYPARETPDMGKSAFDLFLYYDKNVGEAKYFQTQVEVAADILKTARPKEYILLLGAGDIADISKLIMS